MSLLNPIVGNFVVCCARAASGRKTVEPTIPLTKSRRRIALSEAQNCADRSHEEYDYIRDLRPAKWGSGASLHGSNPERLMSALGHSRPSHFVPVLNNVRYASDSDHSRYESELTLWAINVRFESRRTAAKFASLFDEAGGGVRDMTEIDRTGEHA